MIEENRTAQKALEELVDGGYGFHSLWKNIKRYVQEVDVAQLRAAIDAATH